MHQDMYAPLLEVCHASDGHIQHHTILEQIVGTTSHAECSFQSTGETVTPDNPASISGGNTRMMQNERFQRGSQGVYSRILNIREFHTKSLVIRPCAVIFVNWHQPNWNNLSLM